MQIYLVGGALRDKLLGLEVKDRDFVVVGSSAEEMLAAGFCAVGKDFPVFLHPETKEEYALARQERKKGRGHQAFSFDFSPKTTLEQDLLRRDLTINAIAQDQAGNYIDPYSGIKDIEQRILRHVSPAFAEDPLRVLRLFRFYARFYPLGFRIAPETWEICSRIVASGEVLDLSKERIWQETERALQTSAPQEYFQGLAQIGALEQILPRSSNFALRDMNKRLEQALSYCHSAPWRLALWQWGERDAEEVLSQNLPLPKTYQRSIAYINRAGDDFLSWQSLSAEEKFASLQKIKACSQSQDLGDFLSAIALSCDIQAQVFAAIEAAKSVSARDFPNYSGVELGEQIRLGQIRAISELQVP